MWVRSPGGPERLAVTLPPEAGCPRRGGGVGGTLGRPMSSGKAGRSEVPPALGPAAACVSAWGDGLHPGRVSSCLWGPCGAPCRGLVEPVTDRTWGCTRTAGRAEAPSRGSTGCPQHGERRDLNRICGAGQVGGQRGKLKSERCSPGRQRCVLREWLTSRRRQNCAFPSLRQPGPPSVRPPWRPWNHQAATPKTGYLRPDSQKSVLPEPNRHVGLGVLSAAWRTALCSPEALRTRGS